MHRTFLAVAPGDVARVAFDRAYTDAHVYAFMDVCYRTATSANGLGLPLASLTHARHAAATRYARHVATVRA